MGDVMAVVVLLALCLLPGLAVSWYYSVKYNMGIKPFMVFLGILFFVRFLMVAGAPKTSKRGRRK